MNETALMVVNQTVQKSVELISNIDPNWLYSSIAQSSAAIVGLMGAFLTTKLISKKYRIKELDSLILENKAKIDFLKENIQEKEEWVKKIDEEEDLENIKSFLKEIQDEIDVDNPPTVEALIVKGNKSDNEEFHNLNKKMLEKVYPGQYIEKVKERQQKRRLPFGLLNLPELTIPVSPLISNRKWDRYNRYNDEINSTHAEIKYIENKLGTLQNESNAEKAGFDLKSTLYYLGAFSLIGVFLPLFMMSESVEVMFSYRFIVLFAVLLCWLGILAYFIYEIGSLKRDD